MKETSGYDVKHGAGWTGNVEKIRNENGRCIVSVIRGGNVIDFVYPDAFKAFSEGGVFSFVRQEVLDLAAAEMRKTSLKAAPQKENFLMKCDNRGIFYIGDYIRRDKRPLYYDTASVSFSEELIALKSGNRERIEQFALTLVKWLILLIFSEPVKKNLLLVAVPPANASETVFPLAGVIKSACEEIAGEKCCGTDLFPGYNVLDGSDRLRREISIDCGTDAEKILPADDIRFRSLSFDTGWLDDYRREGMTVVILDAITTRGDTLAGCKKRLISCGFEENDIKCLAFGRTKMFLSD